jgi:RNA polymerase sigma-70 factor (ECF subfamily)
MGKRGRTPTERLAAGVGVESPARGTVTPEALPAAPLPCDPDAALLGLFNEIRDELVSTLMYVLGNADDAQDTAQEAFLKCWRSRSSIPDVLNLRAWVFRVGLNAAKDFQRSAWHRKSRPLPEDDVMMHATAESPGALLEDQETVDRLRRAITHLRDEEKEVFLLRQNGELTYEQIAEIRNAPVGTVKTQMRSALQKLRRVLNPEGAGEEAD